jgi:ATP-dependent DNA helicase RecG
MLKSELLEIIANGENSGVEFKRDDIRPEQLAKEVVALANFQGGRILLGVEDDGGLSGIQRSDLEEWVMNVFRDLVHPMLLPFYEEVQVNPQKRVAVISFPAGVSKPYVLRHKGSEHIYIRVGTTSRLASREQQARLFSIGGLLHPELMPVAGTDLRSLDRARLIDYLSDVINDPDVPANEAEWEARAQGLGLLVPSETSPAICSVAGLVLFGINARRYLRQAGLRVMVFSGLEKEYQAELDVTLDAPLDWLNDLWI